MSGPRTIRFTLNGAPAEAQAAPHHTLVEILQEQFNLWGARESCGQGLCGCCTVLVDGEPVSGCLFLAWFADGAAIDTIEGLGAGAGLGAGGRLDPVQEALLEAGAVQCGFCTPGMVLMAKRLLDRVADPGDDEIRHYLAGNLCRCATYPEIIAAVKLAARKLRTRQPG